jgi:hypothetical protein
VPLHARPRSAMCRFRRRIQRAMRATTGRKSL